MQPAPIMKVTIDSIVVCPSERAPLGFTFNYFKEESAKPRNLT